MRTGGAAWGRKSCLAEYLLATFWLWGACWCSTCSKNKFKSIKCEGGENPKMESKMKWMNTIAFQMSITATVKRGKRERIQGTVSTLFYYKCSVLDKVWEKGQKILKYFSMFYVVILAKQFWKKSRCMLALNKWMNACIVLGGRILTEEEGTYRYHRMGEIAGTDWNWRNWYALISEICACRSIVM